MFPPRFVLFLSLYIVGMTLVIMLILRLFFVSASPWMVPICSFSLALLFFASIQVMNVVMVRLFPDLAHMGADYTRRLAEDEGSGASKCFFLVCRTKATDEKEAGAWFRPSTSMPHDSLVDLTIHLARSMYVEMEGYESRPAQALMTFTAFTDEEAERFHRRVEEQREKVRAEAKERLAARMDKIRSGNGVARRAIAVENAHGYLLAERLHNGILRPPPMPFFASHEEAERARSSMEPDEQRRFEIVHGSMFLSPHDPSRDRPLPLDPDPGMGESS